MAWDDVEDEEKEEEDAEEEEKEERERKRAEQRQSFPRSGEGALEGGVRRPSVASWSYLLHLLSLRLLSLTTPGGRPDDSGS